MGRIVGIDLGTTNSVVAVVESGRPRVIENRDAKYLTRSVVSLKRRNKHHGADDEILVGEGAMDNCPLAPEDTVLSIKRLVGRAVTDAEVQKMRDWADFRIVEPSDGTKDSVRVVMGEKEYSPVEISAKILEKLKADAEFRLGEEVTHAVITVPAYFSQIQRAATREAGMLAGLRIIKILEEPTAAAIAFGVDAGGGGDPKNLLVYDMGGGTFDISLLMWAGGVFAPLDLEGDMWLGGDNFDQLLVEYALQRIRRDHGIDPGTDRPFMATLRQCARRVKERLGAAHAADLIVPNMLRDRHGNVVHVEMEITRREFERMIAPLVDKTVRIAQKALAEAELTRDQIDHVLMVGNSTCIPLVQQAMEELFGAEKIRRNVHPKHCVAIGAAILANLLGGVVCQAPLPSGAARECGHVNKLDATVCEKCGAPLTLEPKHPDETVSMSQHGHICPPLGIAPFAYGTQTAGDVFNMFVRKGDPYPTVDPQPQTFYTIHPNQRMISIPVYGGDNLEKASPNEKQGEAFAVLPSNLPKGTGVRVTLWLDDDGCFLIAAQLDDGADLDPWITEGGEDARAIEAIQLLQERLAEKEGELNPEETHDVEDNLRDAFGRMKQHDFRAAFGLARKAAEAVEQAGQHVGVETQEDKADRLIGYSEFVVQEYAWALDSEYVLDLTRLADQTRKHLRAKEMAELRQKVEELDELTDHVPQLVKLVLGLKHAVLGRIRPTDPALARSFMNEIEDAEQALRAGADEAAQNIEGIAMRAYDALCKTEAAPPETRRCSRCGEALGGRRFCPNPNCGQDQLALESKGRGPGRGTPSP